MKKIKLEDFFLDGFIYTLLIIIMIVTFYPMWHVIVASFSDTTDLAKETGFLLWPKRITAGAYKMVFENRKVWTAYKNTLKLVAIGVPYHIILTLIPGYFMSKTRMMWKKPIVFMMLLSMYISGGLIPAYLNIKSLGLMDTIWALILPGGVSVYHAIIFKTSIEALPDGLVEAAYIDGANDIHVLFRIVMPLIKPSIAVISLYNAVGHWNGWLAPSLYLKQESKLPLQNILRAILLANQSLLESGIDGYDEYSETIKYAAIVVSTLPILCFYPFIQKYFVKGVMIGAVKG